MAGWRARALVCLALLVGLAAAAVIAFRHVRAEAESEQRWALVRARGGLRVGIDPSDRQFSFFTADGWQGFDAGLARELTRRLGLTLWVEPVGFDGLYDAIRADRVDVSISALIPDPAQTADIAYSAAYFDAGLALVAGCGPGEAIPACLTGRRLGVALGSDADRLARQWERRVSGFSRSPVDDDAAALAGLGGQNDAALVDVREAWSRLATLQKEGQIIRVVEPRPYVVAAGRGDARLLAEVNAVMAAMRADGSLDRLARKWLLSERP